MRLCILWLSRNYPHVSDETTWVFSLCGATHFTDNLRRFRVVDGLDVLRHGVVVVALLIQVVTVLSIDDVLLLHVHARFLGKVEGQRVEIALIEQLQPLL